MQPTVSERLERMQGSEIHLKQSSHWIDRKPSRRPPPAAVAASRLRTPRLQQRSHSAELQSLHTRREITTETLPSATSPTWPHDYMAIPHHTTPPIALQHLTPWRNSHNHTQNGTIPSWISWGFLQHPVHWVSFAPSNSLPLSFTRSSRTLIILPPKEAETEQCMLAAEQQPGSIFTCQKIGGRGWRITPAPHTHQSVRKRFIARSTNAALTQSHVTPSFLGRPMMFLFHSDRRKSVEIGSFITLEFYWEEFKLFFVN